MGLWYSSLLKTVVRIPYTEGMLSGDKHKEMLELMAF